MQDDDFDVFPRLNLLFISGTVSGREESIIGIDSWGSISYAVSMWSLLYFQKCEGIELTTIDMISISSHFSHCLEIDFVYSWWNS